MYRWVQCLDETCLFRCPAAEDELLDGRCPKCGSLIDEAVEPTTLTLLTAVPQPQPGQMALLLDNIRSVFNVGAMMRTMDGAGVSQLFFCGMTATPNHPKVAKTALGAGATFGWQYQPNSLQTAVSLQQKGWLIWVLERTETAVDLFSITKKENKPILLVVGNERAGVDPAITASADRVVALPMMGTKVSLNVAVAAGIALYTLQFGQKR